MIMYPTAEEIIEWFKYLQDHICRGLEQLDEKGVFHEDRWDRSEGGGGRTRIIQGQHIEKGGVNFSAVHGPMPGNIAQALKLPENNFVATGVSIVLHAANPWVPIIHMNVRYFETDKGHWWFGGGIDATPHLIIPDQARDFHRCLKKVCDRFTPESYQAYKQWADDYFFITHRDETRGIGGIFFDRLDDSNGQTKNSCWHFVKDVGMHFLPSYELLYTPNYQKEYSDDDSDWQSIRRSRYVEFNLVYDKGTKFGLQTNGRIESILMSLPPTASWKYNFRAPSESKYTRTQSLLKKNIDWVNYTTK